MKIRSIPMMRSRLRVLALAASLAAASACSSLAGSARNPFDGSLEQQQEDRLRIQIQNMNFNDITIYAVSSSQRVRLGNVTGKTDQNFRLEWNFANPISFEIDVLGGRGCQTSPLPVEPGARVWVQVPNEVGVSGCRAGRA
jgi:hypothetical protein